MMNLVYVTFGLLLAAALTAQAPIDENNNKNTLQNLTKENRITSNSNDSPSKPFEILYAAENGHHFVKRATTNDLDDADDDEDMDTAADTIYIPYVRYRQYYGQRRRIYSNRRYDNYPALVGYADDRDRFPTVA